MIASFLYIFLKNNLIGWKNCENLGSLVSQLVVGSGEQDNLTNGTPGVARILLHNKVSGLKNLIWQFSLPTRIKSWKYEITIGSEFLSTFFRRLKALFAIRQIFLSNPILNKSLFDPNLLFVNVPKIKSVIGLLWILILACIVHSGPFSTMCQKFI